MAFPIIPLLLVIGGAVVVKKRREAGKAISGSASSFTSPAKGCGTSRAFYGDGTRFPSDADWKPGGARQAVSYLDIATNELIGDSYDEYVSAVGNASRQVVGVLGDGPPPNDLAFTWVFSIAQNLWQIRGCAAVGPDPASWPDPFRILMLAVVNVEFHLNWLNDDEPNPSPSVDMFAAIAPPAWRGAVMALNLRGHIYQGEQWPLHDIQDGIARRIHGSGACNGDIITDLLKLDPEHVESLWGLGSAGGTDIGNLFILRPLSEFDRYVLNALSDQIEFLYGVEIDANRLHEYSKSIYASDLSGLTTRLMIDIFEVYCYENWMRGVEPIVLNFIRGPQRDLAGGATLKSEIRDPSTIGIQGDPLAIETLMSLEHQSVRAHPEWEDAEEIAKLLQGATGEPMADAVQILWQSGIPTPPAYDYFFQKNPGATYEDYEAAVREFETKYPYPALAAYTLADYLRNTFPDRYDDETPFAP